MDLNTLKIKDLDTLKMYLEIRIEQVRQHKAWDTRHAKYHSGKLSELEFIFNAISKED